MKEYSIVIPAFNEADKISATLTQVNTFMQTFAQSYEIVVVDDGSRDNTANIVSDYANRHENIVLVKNPHKGKGIAVLTGMQKAEGEYVYLCDADLSAPIKELKKLSVWIKDQGLDIVIASREGAGAQRVHEPFYRHLMGRVFNTFVQLLVLPGIKDSQCGFKLFRGVVAKEVFSKLKIYTANSNVLKDAYVGAFDVEVLYIAKKLGYKIKEVPVLWTYVKTTRINPVKDSLRMLRDVIKIKINDTKGLYN